MIKQKIIKTVSVAEIVSFVLSLVFYIFTLAPTVTGEDSGELISAAYDWGVAHPPGYPLWTMLAAIWIRICPFGSIAYKVNLLSAVFAALAAAVFCRILKKFFSLNSFAATAGSICFASGNYLWSQAVITEVYTLHILLVCLVIYFALKWQQSGHNLGLYKIAFLCGLALTNHHLAVLLGPVLFLFVVFTKPKVLISARVWIFCLFFLILGLLPYLYLPLAARTAPYINWGDPSNWERFLEHVLRKQYSDDSMHLSRSLHYFLGHLGMLWHWNISQYSLISLPFILAGLIWSWRENKKIFKFMGIFFLMHTIVLSEILNFNFQKQELFCSRVFFLPAYIMTAIWLTSGACKVGEHINNTKILQPIFKSTIKYIPLILVTIASVVINFPKNNMRNYYYALDHADNILNSLERNAIIIPSGDHNTFPLIYRHHVENIRPDITIADKYGYIEYKLYQDMPNAPRKILSRLQREQIEAYLITQSGHPVYYTVKPKLDMLEGYRPVSYGMLFKIVNKDNDTSKMNLPTYKYRNLGDNSAPKDHAANMILSDYYFHKAANLFRQGQRKAAMRCIDEVSKLSEGVKEELNNIGTLLAEFGLNDIAIDFYEQAAKLDRNYLTPRWNLAYLFKSQGKIVNAIQVFNDLANLDPDDYRIFGELGFLLQQHGDFSLAIKNWGKSLSLNPDQNQIIDAITKLFPVYKGPDNLIQEKFDNQENISPNETEK